MAASPRFKVYDQHNRYQAACHEVEAAAAIVGNIYGDGSTIRDGHKRIVWTEGSEEESASNSYDFVARTVRSRIE